MTTHKQELDYKETYTRAYRLRHPGYVKMRIFNAILSFVVIVVLIISGCSLVSYAMEDQRVTEWDNSDITSISNSVLLTETPSELWTVERGRGTPRYYPSEPVLTEAVVDETELVNIEVFDDSMLQDDTNVLTDKTSSNTQVAQRDTLTAEELEYVERVVEAEVTGTEYVWNNQYVNETEMLKSKIRVAQVFLNRVDNTSQFSNIKSLYDAVSYPGASSTVLSGRYLRVKVTDLTKEAVQIALDPNTEDMTDGALYFLADGATTCLYGDYLFTDAVGHSFFK